MSESSQQKTESATPKRKRDARKKGQVARSRELSTGLVVGASLVGVMASGHSLAGKGLAMMRQSLVLEPGLIGDPDAQIALMFHRLFEALVAVAPIMVAGLVAAIAGPALLGGWNFGSQAFSPQFSRIDPLSGLARMFSPNALVELGKSLLKFCVLGAIGALYVWKHRDPLMALSTLDLAASIREALGLAVWALVWMSAGLLLVAFVDAPYQWWKHQKELRMTKQEVREEMKESDGKPEVKARIRQLQHQLASRRMMDKVPTADVVITNPTHYAVAIRYSAGKMRAPVVVAKGSGVIAAAIRELATQSKVPLVSAPPLARALYRSVELDREIPGDLYQAVATVLTYLYQLRNGTLRSKPDFEAPVPGGEPDVEPESAPGAS
ncbi:flagellar biosynthesis protein FlhB [Hydrocarboniphaga sp.]|uniref:flagellar biosynthesis protein FlhB n=1 Tax=Hydrocarboniphaga sp. TaxID=2033016 RepID=UPI002ABBE358|nr:flagellar biosynthesis protein FlhB [Hydrocarboniphaga sp.]MDZ4077257.1 flagellar biosynthesis protein FlhB [Hydrocarboniphaga sp.]